MIRAIDPSRGPLSLQASRQALLEPRWNTRLAYAAPGIAEGEARMARTLRAICKLLDARFGAGPAPFGPWGRVAADGTPFLLLALGDLGEYEPVAFWRDPRSPGAWLAYPLDPDFRTLAWASSHHWDPLSPLLSGTLLEQTRSAIERSALSAQTPAAAPSSAPARRL